MESVGVTGVTGVTGRFTIESAGVGLNGNLVFSAVKKLQG